MCVCVWVCVCVCVLGAMGLSLPPLTPSLELHGVWPAALCCRQRMRPGSSLPAAQLARGLGRPLYLGNVCPFIWEWGALGPSSWCKERWALWWHVEQLRVL